MPFDPKFMIKVFSPRVVVGALARLDKATAVLVTACWAAAIVMLIMANLAVQDAAFLKKGELETVSLEPILPQVTTSAISPDEIQVVYSRLQRQFPNLKIGMDADQRLEIKSDDGLNFQQWIAALSSVETIAPQFHWSLSDLCVGFCGERGLMSAVVSGVKKGFSLPQR